MVPEFIVQGGDPTGTGMGGESIYGRPFKVAFAFVIYKIKWMCNWHTYKNVQESVIVKVIVFNCLVLFNAG